MNLKTKSINKYCAFALTASLVAVCANPAAAYTNKPNTNIEVYIPDETISVDLYNVSAFIRCDGGLVGVVEGELVVKSLVGGEFWISYRITDEIPHLDEMTDKNWSYCFDIQGAMLDSYTTQAITAYTDYKDCLVTKHFTPENPYQEYDLAQIKFIPDSPLTAKTYITSSGTADTNYDNVLIPIYTEKTYETLKAENERLIEQAKCFQEIIDYINSSEFNFAIVGDGKINMKDAMFALKSYHDYEYSDEYWADFERDYNN